MWKFSTERQVKRRRNNDKMKKRFTPLLPNEDKIFPDFK